MVDVSSLKIYVSHPNGTKSFIKQIGTLRLTDKITLFDVLVIPEYCVSLLSVQKLVKDNKLFLGFDDTYCYIQDLNTRKILRTGKVTDGLYVLNIGTGLCNYSIKMHVSCQNLCGIVNLAILLVLF